MKYVNLTPDEDIKMTMESKVSSQEIKCNSDFLIHNRPPGISGVTVSPHFRNFSKSVQNLIVSPIEVNQYCIKENSSANEEDHIKSTPLSTAGGKRSLRHSVDLNAHCCGVVKTPVSNTRKTPLKIPMNPFDAVLMDRLHLPICSPSIFTKSTDYDDKEFKWDIEQQATLFPAPIEEELHAHHHVHEHYDSETESKLQEAIDKFYERRVIAPSPWIATKKSGLERGLSTLISKEDYLDSGASCSHLIPHSELKSSTQDAGTQTLLSLPFHLPPELVCALQKYTLPADEDPASASSSIITMESESLSTSTRRKLFNVEDMSISCTTPNCDVVTLKSPTRDSPHIPQAASSSPIKGGSALSAYPCNDDMDEDDVQTGVLESSQTTFWKATASPPFSPIAFQRPSPYSTQFPKNEAGIRNKHEDLHQQYTPPSSRTKSKHLFPYCFAPLLEKDEEGEDEKFSKSSQDEKSPSHVEVSPGDRSIKPGPEIHLSGKQIHQQGESKSLAGNSHVFSESSLKSVSSKKLSIVSTSQHQPQVSVLQGASERFDSLAMDDTCTSRMQDTGYQTVSMTTLPGTSVSSNSLKPRSCMVMPMDSGSSMDNFTSGPIRGCEDGYTSLSFNKINVSNHMSMYNEESMIDVWHSSPPPLACSTPAKNFGGFLM